MYSSLRRKLEYRKVTVLFAMAGIRDEEIGESVFDDGDHYLIRFAIRFQSRDA